MDIEDNYEEAEGWEDVTEGGEGGSYYIDGDHWDAPEDSAGSEYEVSEEGVMQTGPSDAAYTQVREAEEILADVNVQWERASLAKELGDFRTAKTAFLVILKQYPHDIVALEELRPVLVELSEITKGIELYQAAFDSYQERYPTGTAVDLSGNEVPGGGFSDIHIIILAKFYNSINDPKKITLTIRRGARWLQGRGNQRLWDNELDDREFDLPNMARRGQDPSIMVMTFPLDLNFRHRLAISWLMLGDPEEGKIHCDIILENVVREHAVLFTDLVDVMFQQGLFNNALAIYEVLSVGETVRPNFLKINVPASSASDHMGAKGWGKQIISVTVLQASFHQISESEDDPSMVELESMQHFDETEVESSIPTGNLSSSPSSPHNSSQHTLSSLGSESDLSDVEIMDEDPCQSFATKMQQNLTKFLETKHARAQKIREETKALRQAGFRDIREYFKQRRATSPVSVIFVSSSSEPETTEAPKQVIYHQEEEEETEEEDGKGKGALGASRIMEPTQASVPHDIEPRSTLGTNPHEPASIVDSQPDQSSLVEMALREFEISQDEFHDEELKGSNPHASPPSPDSPMLEEAIEALSKHLKNKNLDALLRARLTAMVRFLAFIQQRRVLDGKNLPSWQQRHLDMVLDLLIHSEDGFGILLRMVHSFQYLVMVTQSLPSMMKMFLRPLGSICKVLEKDIFLPWTLFAFWIKQSRKLS
ncbi:hypothetical protein M422DRAFT_776976 [Sphaerobolus stellatus SS14]|nr:hypothetical protein M422DRAFT_776976 [Sphaerobolus stellatus SS14]